MKLGVIAGCISVLAFIPYISSILKGKTRPNRVTWWIWSALGILLFFSYRSAGATDTLWVAINYIISPLLIAFLSIRFGEGRMSRLDSVCVAGAAIATLLWFASGSPRFALLCYIGIDFLGLLPTIKKTWEHPSQEENLSWFLMVIANTVNIFASNNYDFYILLYPVYMVLSGGLILSLSLRRKP